MFSEMFVVIILMCILRIEYDFDCTKHYIDNLIKAVLYKYNYISGYGQWFNLKSLEKVMWRCSDICFVERLSFIKMLFVFLVFFKNPELQFWMPWGKIWL